MALKEIILIFAVLLTVLVLALGGNARASPPDEEWNQTYGWSGIDRANHFQQTSDGGYIFAGTTCLYEKCSSDIRLLRTDSNGNEQWNKTIGLPYDSSFDLIQQTLDGGYILAGRTVSSGMTNRDTWLAKIDANGNEQWNRTFNLDGYEGTSYVWQTSDEGYVLAGHIYTRKYPDPRSKIGYTDSDVLLIKTDKKGNSEWNKTLGGLKNEWAKIVQQTSDGGYIFAGGTESYGSGKSDIWLVRTDHEGEEQWNRTYGGNSSDWANSVQETFDGGFIIAGLTESYGAGHRDLFLVKTDLNGNEQWNRRFGGIGHEFFSSVEQTIDGGYILGGRAFSFDGDFWLIQTDLNGNIKWDRTFGRGLESFQQISDGCFILTGDTRSDQERKILLVKTNPEGEELWEKSFEGNSIHYVVQTFDGGYILAGENDSDLWLVKLSKEGPNPTAFFRYNPLYTGTNQTITFDASSSYDPDGNITNYQWDFGDMNITNTTEKTISHSYDLKGKYYVVLTVKDNDGAMNSIRRKLIVQKSAPPIMNWDMTFGGTGDERIYSMLQTSDGGYILAGTVYSYIKGSNVILVKTDPNGKFEWEKIISGRESYEIYSVARTNDGGFLIAGRNYDADSIWIMKSDFEGNEQWNDTFGGYGFDEIKFSDQTSDGGFIFSGSTSSNGVVSHGSLLVRTDPEGSELWNRTYRGTGFNSLELFSKTRDGGYLLGGITSPFGSSDVWLVRTDSEGVELWNRTFGDPDSNDRLYSFQQTSDGGFILAGTSKTPKGLYYFQVIKIDPEGVELWNRYYDGNGNEKAYSISQTSDGGYIAAGERKSAGTSYDIWVMKTDSNGKLQWQESFGGTGYDVARSVLQTLDGGYIIGGDLDSCSNEGIDFWLIKLGGISGEPEGGNIRTDGEPEKTPDIPGFSASVSVLGLMVCVGLAGRRR